MNLEQLSVWATLSAGTVLVFKILVQRMRGIYAVVAALVIVDATLSGLAFVWPLNQGVARNQIDYRVAWLVTRPASWIIVLIALTKLLSAILASYPGIARLSRQCLTAAWLASVAIALFAIIPEFRLLLDRSRFLGIRELLILGLAGERAIMIVALLVLFCISTFLLWFPVRIPRNIVILSLGFLFYFLAQVAGLFAVSFMLPSLRALTNTIISFCAASCYAFWAVFLSRSGEFAKASVSAPLQPRQQERLLQQLELLNQSLVRR